MLKFLLEKEFRQIFRNPFIPKMIFVFPVMVLLIFPWAANYEIKNINLSVVDNDHSVVSERLVKKIVSSGYFRLADVSSSEREAMKGIESNRADVIFEIPQRFEKSIINREPARVMISANAVNGMKAGLSMTYLYGIVNDYSADLRSEQSPAAQVSQNIGTIDIVPDYQFNRHLDYKVYMVPALMVMVLTLLCGFLPALSIVMEKEFGTIEQINVSSVSKAMFILGKLIPYWMVGCIAITIGFIIARFVYGLMPLGHFYTLYFFAMIYILSISGMGLIISNFASTMQQAMFMIFFFIVVFILLSGLFTPVGSMPEWAQWVAAFNPLKHFMEVMRAVYLKGSNIADLSRQLWAMLGFLAVFNLFAVLSYRKKS